MIRYALRCAREHEFEGWFSASADYDAQRAAGLLEWLDRQHVTRRVGDGREIL